MSATSIANIATPHARKYLVQLCKHFQHKRPASWSDDAGAIRFTIGDCNLAAAADALTVTVVASEAGAIAELEDVVARHLVRFAFREELAIHWERSAGQGDH